MISAMRFEDAGKTTLSVVVDGKEWRGIQVISVDGAYRVATDSDIGRQVDELLAAGAMPLQYVAPTPTGDDVRAEANRRMQRLLNARDALHLDLLITNGTREAVRLLRRGAQNWTPQEAERAASLEQIDGAIEHIRARSNAMEPAPPADFRDDVHWL